MSASTYISSEEGNRYTEITKHEKSGKFLVLGGIDGEDEQGEGEPLLITDSEEQAKSAAYDWLDESE